MSLMIEKARVLLLSNYRHTGGEYVCPAWPHYPHQYAWDSDFHAIVLAFLGEKELAKREIFRRLEHQREDGFLPRMIFKKRRYGWLRGLESYFFNGRCHSDSSQPVVIAQALKWIDDDAFTRDVFERVLKVFLYFIEKQDPDGDGLISSFHPVETGRDASPEFDRFIWRIPGKHRLLNTALQILSWAKWSAKYRLLGWDVKKIWQSGGVDIEDLMVNTIWVDGMYLMAEFAPPEKQQKIRQLASRTEQAILNLCWDKEDKMFYALDRENKFIKTLTVGNLFPLLLPNLPREQARILVDNLTDPAKFWTPYPIPSVAVNDRRFDGANKGKFLLCNWDGPTWINTNWYLIQGLLRHGYGEVAREVAQRTLAMVEREGFWEFYNPFTGKGMRVKDFGWSTLAVTFPRLFD